MDDVGRERSADTVGGQPVVRVAGKSVPASVGFPEQVTAQETGSDSETGIKGEALALSDEVVHVGVDKHGTKDLAIDVIVGVDNGTSIARALAGGDSSSSMFI